MAQMVLQDVFDKVKENLPGIAVKYAKRGLEHVYDRAFETPLGQKLKAMRKSKKYAVEFFLYGLTELFESSWEANTAISRSLKEIAVDATPEAAKRMINDVRTEIAASIETSTVVKKELASLLLELEDKELVELLNWLYQKTPVEKWEFLNRFSLLSAEQIARLMRFSVEDREKFFGILNPRPQSEKTGPGILGIMTEDVRKLRQRFRS